MNSRRVFDAKNLYNDEVENFGEYKGQYGKSRGDDGTKKSILRFKKAKTIFYKHLNIDKNTKLAIKLFNSLGWI